MLENELWLIVEIKGRYMDDSDVKARAAERWVKAVNAIEQHGVWAYAVVDDPQRLGPAIDAQLQRDTTGARSRVAVASSRESV